MRGAEARSGSAGALLCLLLPLAAPGQDAPYRITLRSAATGAPVPCASVRTVHKVVFRSDIHGQIAFWEPGLMDQTVWFETVGPPWELPADGFGFTGASLPISAGGEGELLLNATGAPGPCEADDADSQLLAQGLPPLSDRHGVRVLDAETGRGVPLVELRSGARSWVTDSAGWVAILEPGWLGETRSFTASSHGYRPMAATSLSLDRGGRSALSIERLNPAERLYRVTGGGIYRDSVLLGEPAPLAQPVLNALVVGMDSNHSALHGGRVFWVWGDTLRPAYPLGHFRTSGATSLPPGAGGLAPEDGVDLSYFTRPEDGFARPVADVVEEGLVWTSALVSLPSDSDASSELVAQYAQVAGGEAGSWSEEGGGFLRWNPEEERFDELTRFPQELPAIPRGTAFLEGGYLYFTDVSGSPAQLQVLRIPANLSALRDPRSYQTWTAIDSTGQEHRVDGRPDHRWRPAAPPTRDTEPAGRIGLHLRDPFADTEVADHIGSVFWNDFARRYLRISARPFGDDAFLGETWLSVADTPMGPWAWATQVVTHDDYSFYNPRQHPEFDQEGGRQVYFEGTYSETFSGSPTPTPRYDYNQVMYRQDLSALTLPVAVYGEGLWTRDTLPPDADAEPARFFALDREAPNAVPLRWTGPDCAPRSLSPDGEGELAFWALESGESSPHLVPLYPHPAPGRGTRYGLSPEPGASPIGWVWPNPIDLPFPVGSHGPLRAEAGPDQCPEDGQGLHLNASASGAASFSWSWDGGSAQGAAITADFAPGVHVVTLLVTSDDGHEDRDVVVIEVGGARACACGTIARVDGAPLGFALLLLWWRRHRRPSLRMRA